MYPDEDRGVARRSLKKRTVCIGRQALKHQLSKSHFSLIREYILNQNLRELFGSKKIQMICIAIQFI